MESLDYWYGKRDLFLAMKDLALKQKESVMEGHMDLFKKRTAKRDGLQREMASKEKTMKAMSKAPASPPTEPKTRELAEEISGIIASIQDIDRQIETFISGKQEDLLMEMKALRGGKKALKGYGGKNKRVPRFIDTQG